MGDLWGCFDDFFGWSCCGAEAYDSFFGSWDAAFDDDVRVFDVAVSDVSAFGGDFFAVFADFEDALVVFYALVVAHLSCSGDAVHEVVGVPGSEGSDAAFGFSAFVLEFGDVPAFDWSLEAFADGDGGDVDLLAVFEDFFAGDGFAEEGFCVVYLLLGVSAADFDFVEVGFFAWQAGLCGLRGCYETYVVCEWELLGDFL